MIPATIEVAYSDARKSEMRLTDQTDCVLVHNIVRQIIAKYCSGEIKVVVPTNKKTRYSDVCFDFRISSEDELLEIQNEIKNELKQSLKSVNGFIFPPDDSF